MLDLVSTRPNTDEQTRRCARLLASVIWHAIRDLADGMDPEERRTGMRRGSEAWEAARFLFDDASPFRVYAMLIGGDAQAIRSAILEVHGDMYPGGLTAMDRRVIRHRVREYERRRP